MAKSLQKKVTQERLALVPDVKYDTSYVHRTLPGGVADFDMLEVAYQLHMNVLLFGPTGSAKTSFVMAYAAHWGLPFYSVSGSIGLEPSQLFGKYVPNEDGSFTWQDGPVTDLVRHGGVLLLNEVNFIPPRIATVLFSLLDKRREIQLVDHHGEVITAHDELLIVADMNPEYRGTQALNEAFLNRFPFQVEWDYDPNVEDQLVEMKPLLSIAYKLRESYKTGEVTVPTPTNALIEFQEVAFQLGVAFAIANFVARFPVEERSAVEIVMKTFVTDLEDAAERMAQAESGASDAVDDGSFSYVEVDDSDDDVLPKTKPKQKPKTKAKAKTTQAKKASVKKGASK